MTGWQRRAKTKSSKYVSLFENKQLQIDWNLFVSIRLITKAKLNVIGINWGLSLSVLCRTIGKITPITKQETIDFNNNAVQQPLKPQTIHGESYTPLLLHFFSANWAALLVWQGKTKQKLGMNKKKQNSKFSNENAQYQSKKSLVYNETFIRLDLRLFDRGCNLSFHRQSNKILKFFIKAKKLKNPLIFSKKYFQRFKQTISFQIKTVADRIATAQECNCPCYFETKS